MLDKAIAWEQLKDYPKQFYLNTFNLKTQRMSAFSKSNLTPETFWAALAMPWLYEPTRVGDRVYTEGASHDPTGLGSVLRHWNRAQRDERGGGEDRRPREQGEPDIVYQTGDDVLSLIRSGTLSDRDNFNPTDISKIIVLETISSNLWTNPETIHEAIELTIMEPIVTLSEVALATYGLFEWVVNKEGSENCVLPPLYGVPFEVPDWEISDILRWSYSSALTLWNTGHSAGRRFINDYRSNNDLKAYRYYPNAIKNPRVKEMLRLFRDLLAHRPEAKDLL
jgi:hypothetical protein